MASEMKLSEKTREIIEDALKIPLALPVGWGNIVSEIESLESDHDSLKRVEVMLLNGSQASPGEQSWFIGEALKIIQAGKRVGKVCSKCKGSGKLQDDVYDWVVVKCFVCDGTGIEPEWYTRAVSKAEEDARK